MCGILDSHLLSELRLISKFELFINRLISLFKALSLVFPKFRPPSRVGMASVPKVTDLASGSEAAIARMECRMRDSIIPEAAPGNSRENFTW